MAKASNPANSRMFQVQIGNYLLAGTGFVAYIQVTKNVQNTMLSIPQAISPKLILRFDSQRVNTKRDIIVRKGKAGIMPGVLYRRPYHCSTMMLKQRQKMSSSETKQKISQSGNTGLLKCRLIAYPKVFSCSLVCSQTSLQEQILQTPEISTRNTVVIIPALILIRGSTNMAEPIIALTSATRVFKFDELINQDKQNDNSAERSNFQCTEQYQLISSFFMTIFNDFVQKPFIPFRIMLATVLLVDFNDHQFLIICCVQRKQSYLKFKQKVQFAESALCQQISQMGKKKKGFQLQFNFIERNLQQTYEFIAEPGERFLTFGILMAYLQDFLDHYEINTDVTMTYAVDSDHVLVIEPNFSVPFDTIHNLYCGVFIVMLEPQVNYLNQKLDQIQSQIETLCEQLRLIKENAYPVLAQKEILRRILSGPETLIKIVSGFFKDAVIDFALMFSEPLILSTSEDHKIPLVVEPCRTASQLSNFRKVLMKSSQNLISMKASIATRQTFKEMLREAPTVMILNCPGNIQEQNGREEYFLYFESTTQMGQPDIFTQKDMQDQLNKFDSKRRPKMFIIASRSAIKMGYAILRCKVPYVLAISTEDLGEDPVSQQFIELMTLLILKGETVERSFQQSVAAAIADRINKGANMGICCCFHPHEHFEDCRQKFVESEIGLARCHELYHVAMCKCPKKSDSIHRSNCQWAIEALFNINKRFRIVDSDGSVRRLYKYELDPYIKDDELLLCCCFTIHDSIEHSNRFKLLKEDNTNNLVIFSKADEQDFDVQAEVTDLTQTCLIKEQHRIQRIYGRNSDVIRMIQEFRDLSNRVLILHGPVGSGRSSLVSKAMSYMNERHLLEEETLYLNLTNCSKKVDFQFKFCQKSMVVSNYQQHELTKAYGGKKLILILDNCDSFLSNSDNEFAQEITSLMQLLPQTHIIIIISTETEKEHPSFLLGEKRIGLPPLNKYSASDMFLRLAKDYLPLKELNIRNYWELFSDNRLCEPKTIQDMVYFLRAQNANRSKLDFNTLKTYAEKMKHNLTTSQKFLEQNIKNLQKDTGLFEFFPLLTQFPNGLSELDFEIMASHDVEGQYTFIPSRWRQMVTTLLSVNSSDSSNEPSQIEFMKEGDYYFCCVQNKYGNYKKMRIKKYIIEYLKKMELGDTIDLQFKAIAYLSTFSSVLLKIFRDRGYHLQKILQHNSFSRCGFFQIQKSSRFADLFDSQDYYPDRTVNMTRSILHGRAIDSQIRHIFLENKVLQHIEPYKCILQHQLNFTSFYHFDTATFYSKLGSEKRKLFKYYFQNILINFPTLIKLVPIQISRSFLYYTIEQSIKKVNSLDPTKVSFTDNLLLIKLGLMRADFELEKPQPASLTAQQAFMDKLWTYTSIWPKNCSVQVLLKLQELFLTLYTEAQTFAHVTGKQQLTLLHNIFQTVQRFEDWIEEIKSEKDTTLDDVRFRTPFGVNSINAKFHLVLGCFYFKDITKSRYLREFNMFCSNTNLLQKLIIARDFFQKQSLKNLQIEALILITRLKLHELEGGNLRQEVSEYMNIFKTLIKPCRKILEISQLNSKEIEAQLAALESMVNRRIWLATKDVVVLMRAAPLVDSNGVSIMINGVRKSSSLQHMMEEAIIKKLQAEKIQKEIFARFQILTLQNFFDVVNTGCSILMINVNVEKDLESNDLVLQTEADWGPFEERLKISTVLTKIPINTVELLVLIGRNCSLLAQRIEKQYPEPALMISIDYLPVQNFMNRKKFNIMDEFSLGYYEYCVRTLQKQFFLQLRVISAQFFKVLCEHIISSDRQLKSKDIYQLFKSAMEKTIVYSIGFSKQITNRADFQTIVKFKFHDAKQRNLELLFEPGQYHNISTFNHQLHNVRRRTERFVGRQIQILQLLKHLQKCIIKNEPSLVCIHGVKLCGKTVFLEEAVKILLERGQYQSGIYILPGLQIETAHNGNIYEYLQKKKKEVFDPEYLREKDLDGQKVLIIIDDYHILKEKRLYLSKFLNTIHQVKVNLIITSREPLTAELISQLPDRQILNISVSKLRNQQTAELAYTFIPLYDFDNYVGPYATAYYDLKSHYEGGILPKILVNEFRRLYNKAMRNFHKQSDRYPSYKEYNQYFQKTAKQKKYKKSSKLMQKDSSQERRDKFKFKKTSHMDVSPEEQNTVRLSPQPKSQTTTEEFVLEYIP